MPGEAPALTALTRQAKQHWGYPDAWMALWHDELVVPAEAIAAGHVWVAVRADDIVGYVRIEQSEASLQTPTVWELEQLYVAPSSLRGGIRKVLFCKACACARDAGATIVRTDADPHAEGFYLACGMTRIGATPSAVIAGRALSRLELSLELSLDARRDDDAATSA
ncbi:MAG: GNAT family N-acetyltransferase [Pseudomonadota bacterium]